MQIPLSEILKIKDIDKFSYNLEEGALGEMEIRQMLESKWEYNGREISGQNLLKILDFIKVEMLADQGQQKA
ncbi:hypothetical protein [Paenibacillus silvae]|uniref:Uncharacterized protein n=1 Tax=Paenibacillus silvae TaxID=1325358 RepID=A0A2W6NEI7_9BACL|nr:hypothetical protein [Paenibacillus silvae]PZT54105.1 hypothetical protein DN757_18925 [Paenibacillus silvae]